MSYFSRKKLAIALGAIGVSITGILYFTRLSGERIHSAPVDPAYGEYIASYTAGVVSSGSVIRVVLSGRAVDSLEIGRETSVKLFEFSPSIKGKTIWIDPYTVEFRPESRLLSGQVYETRFFLSKIIAGVPSDLSTLTYTFQVIPQNFEISVENVRPYMKTELKRQQLEGIIRTADLADNADVEKIVSAEQEGRELEISWTHSPDRKEHTFVVGNIERKDVQTQVTLTVDGKAIGINKVEKREVEIPSLGDFRVMNARVVHYPDQYVVLQFSDPLKEKQNLDGLITISGVTSLDYDIQGNEIRVYPPIRQAGSKKITVSSAIRNILDYRLKEASTFEIVFEQIKPAVRFTGKGNILPSSDGLVLPFEAVNLKAVDVRIIRIFENNVLQFLQRNSLDGNEELRRVGIPVVKKTISLENAGVTDLGRWNRFTLDLSTLIHAEPGAIYEVQIGFRKPHSLWECNDSSPEQENLQSFDIAEEWSEPEADPSYWDSYETYYYGDDYLWSERDNPCHSSYYTGQRNIRKNVLASDLGLLAKRGSDGNTLVFVNDLKTTLPLSGVEVQLYSYQQQLLGKAVTDASGKAVIHCKETPFAVIAKQGTQRGYLKMNNGESLSLSSFDVGGEQIKRGIKGFLYGERGVWRPGDSLYLTFILEDKMKILPPTHPVVFELEDPRGFVASRLVRSSSENGFYRFATATLPDAPTGNWKARVKVGGTEFTQPVRIETIKPNRLKINFDLGVDKITWKRNNVSGNLQVNWLHGAPGKHLKAEFEVLLTKGKTTFPTYPDYTFEDPSRDFYSEAQLVFEGYTNSDGYAPVNATLEVPSSAPGVLNAVFRGKVFEESGNFSVDRFSIPYYPFESFTGIRLPKGDEARGMLLTDTTHQVDIVTIDADGKPVTRQAVEVSLYKLRWRWWWDNSMEDPIYMTNSYATVISKGTVATPNGKGTWKFRVNYPEWGRFLVKAYDPVSGHSTAKIVYIDWPGWAGRARPGADGATMLSFSSDKNVYQIGEQATVVIPGSSEGRALVSIENGSRVINSYWVETQKGDTPFRFDITPDMSPNIFLHITHLQPHAQTINDLPMRLYGVIPIQVEDPATHLQPELKMPDVLEPGKEVAIQVSERSNRTMTYTIAVVDEGLLDLTRFKTPDPWKRFYAREALGVKTWDVYDKVMGAFGPGIERLLAVGGDGEVIGKEGDKNANRFKPVVKFFGPFTLKGGSTTHRFVMPPYIGSVKTMLVAGYEGAYGTAEKTTPVRKPLMVLTTLPRVLGPDEKLKLPVTIFTMEENIRQVNVEVKVSGPLEVKEKTRRVTVTDTDQTVDFDLAVKNATGIGKIEVTATSGNYKATESVEIQVRNPNPRVTRVQEVLLEAGKKWNGNLPVVGMPGTNAAAVELSVLPPINLEQRMKYLLQYPYGCVEQTVSSVFPQLYVHRLREITESEQSTIQTNIRAGIDKLRSFQQRDGSFAYWPGAESTDSWSTTYAGHFLLEAENAGYFIPNEVLNRWKRYQRNMAQSWKKKYGEGRSNVLIQAYRLYSLAVAGSPEMSAMNRLREESSLPVTAAWMLAAAYAKAGQPEAAKKIIEGLPITVQPYQEMSYSYGSDLRDAAIILETLVLLNERTKAFEVMKRISEALGDSSYWMSTQTIAWCLKSVSLFASGEKKGSLKFNYTYNGKKVTAGTDLPVARITLPVDGVKSNALELASESEGTLFVRLIGEGIPTRGMEEDESNNLEIQVAYTDLRGNPIDPARLEQGTEFIAAVTVLNPGVRGDYKNLALRQVFPPGWEINNLRLDDSENRLDGDKPDYQDIRDDRVYTHFDLKARERKTFKVMLTASYAGVYYLPAVSCEAMYEGNIYARKKGQEVEVVKPVRPGS